MHGKPPSPYLSVTLAAHNVAPWVGQTLQTLRSQTFEDWECVAVDDGSQDETGNLLDETTRSDIRFHVVHQPQGGLPNARNRGVALAKGQWIGFLDGDDVVASWWLASVAHGTKTSGVSLVRHGYHIWRGGVLPQSYKKETADHILGQDAIHAWGWHAFAVAGFSWRCFVLREIAKSVSFCSDLPLKEDCVYGFDLLPFLAGVYDCHDRPHYYRRRRGSMLHSMCPAEAPLRLMAHARRILKSPLPEKASQARFSALAIFVFRAVTDWALRPKAEPRDRIDEVRRALAGFLSDGTFTFRQLVPLWWRPSTWLFLRIGWLWPMRIGGVCACVMFKLRQHLHLRDTP